MMRQVSSSLGLIWVQGLCQTPLELPTFHPPILVPQGA